MEKKLSELFLEKNTIVQREGSVEYPLISIFDAKAYAEIREWEFMLDNNMLPYGSIIRTLGAIAREHRINYP